MEMRFTAVTCAEAVANNRTGLGISQQAVAVVRHLRQGNFEDGIQAFCKLPKTSRNIAVTEAVILACTHVPDAGAAAAVLRSMPQPSIAAVSHVVTAYCREQNFEAAVQLCEQVPHKNMLLDPRIILHIRRTLRKHDREKMKLLRDANHRSSGVNGEPRSAQSLISRLDYISRHHTTKNTGLRDISITSGGFFCDAADDSAEWMIHRMREHERSRAHEAGVKACRAEQHQASEGHFVLGENAPDHDDVSLDELRGNFSRVEKLHSSLRSMSLQSRFSVMLSRIIPGFLSCGSSGHASALDALCDCCFFYATKCRTVDSENGVDRPLALLLTTITTTLSACAVTAPRRALEAYDAIEALDLKGFRTSLPLSGTYYNILRLAKLPLQETCERVNRLRKFHVQLDERSFSMAISALLNSEGPAQENWYQAKRFFRQMQDAGICPTIHTFNAFASRLRSLNNPELATSLLRSVASYGLQPSAKTYSLIFDSCVIPSRFHSETRRGALPPHSLVQMLVAIERHMLEMGIAHTGLSRVSLARAYAHLGEIEKALHHFDQALVRARHSNKADWKLSHRDGILPHARSRHQNVRFVVDKEVEMFNSIMYSFAHGRCYSPDGPLIAFKLFDRMLAESVAPTAETLEVLLDSAVRIGDTERALIAVKQFAKFQLENSVVYKLRSPGVENIFCILARAGSPEAWNTCRLFLEQSIERVSGEAVVGNMKISDTVVELAIVAFARKNHADICSAIMEMTGFVPENWEMGQSGRREFQRFR